MTGPASGAAGVVVVDKPAGWTSHQVVGRIRRIAGTRKVGHAGTLDPMATGVLVVGIGRATRLLGYLSHTDKEYHATIRLGVGTITDDAEGEVTQVQPVPSIDPDRLAAAAAALTGDIAQVPSAVSAVKIDGVRSYAKVRSGEQVNLAARPVTVHRFDLLAHRADTADGAPVVDVDVVVGCSSGTYVRALARDLAAELETCGHLTSLRRTRVGAFDLERARSLTACETDLGLIDITDVAGGQFATVHLDDEQAARVRNGRPLASLALPASPTAVLGPDGTFLALYRPDGSDAVAEAVFV